ncbi:Mth938-like domain-containing protein [Francisellaceae bacterium CB300]
MMSLQEEKIDAPIYFKEYVDGVIKLNIGDYNEPIIIAGNQLVSCDEKIGCLADIKISHLKILLESSPEVIIIGTGGKQALPAITIITELAKLGKSADFMSSQQACKTYNLLVNEGRNVSCIII